VPLLGQIPLEPAVAAGGDSGQPVSLQGSGPAAEMFRGIARRIIDDIAPPTNMAGCSARMLHLVEDALAAKDAATANDTAANDTTADDTVQGNES
jgi:ATP-binding protein involved in chromosome partitioning